jgi:hypothetical protein
MTIKQDTKVRCLRDSIDKQLGQGLVGRVDGFARFSSYHAREVFVKFGSDPYKPHACDGWFWIHDVEPVAE